MAATGAGFFFFILVVWVLAAPSITGSLLCFLEVSGVRSGLTDLLRD